MKRSFILFLILTVLSLCVFAAGCVAAYSDSASASSDGVNLSGDVQKDNEITKYISGNQIVLYLNGEPSSLSDFGIVNNGYDFVIKDESVVELSDNTLYPKKAGITYMSCYQTDCIINYNIVVYSGTKNVNSITLNVNGMSFDKASLGSRCVLEASGTSGKCDMSDIDISLKVCKITPVNGIYVETDVDPDEILTIDENGNVTIVGVGVVKIKARSATNKFDQGKECIIQTFISDTTLEKAVGKYFKNNNIATVLGEGSYTKSELGLIEELEFDDIYSLYNEEIKLSFTGLKKAVFDFSQSYRQFNGEKLICSGDYDNVVKGNPQRVYDMRIGCGSKSEAINIEFRDFNMESSSSALDFSNVDFATLNFNGKCSFSCTSVYRGAGSSAIVAKDISVRVNQNAELFVKGGNGGESINDTVRIGGGRGIFAEGNVFIHGSDSADPSEIVITGGNGEQGVTHMYGGVNASDGGPGITCEMLSCDNSLNITVVGGNGGNGSTAKDIKSDGGIGGAGGPALSVDFLELKDGVSMTLKGGAGGSGGAGSSGKTSEKGFYGGRGGNGGDGFEKDTQLNLLNGQKLLIYGGNAGRGGNGGAGGNGLDGIAEGRNTTAGGTGGKGGPGGIGGSLGFDNVLVGGFEDFVVVGGAGGDGGTGGNGGAGGNGATLSADTLVISWVNDYGYRGGNGGNAGDGGYGGSAGQSYNSQENVPSSGGSRGQVGSGGTGGWRRAKSFWGGWAEKDYFPAGSTPQNNAVDGKAGTVPTAINDVERDF